MDNLIPTIRNAVRALIVRDHQILLLRKEDEATGERFALPGGAQDLGETLLDALARECAEEIGTEVHRAELIHVADYFKLRNTTPPTRRHLVEFMFTCSVPHAYSPRNGHHPDKHQVEVVWIPLARLHDIQLLPRSLASFLINRENDRNNVYIGTID